MNLLMINNILSSLVYSEFYENMVTFMTKHKLVSALIMTLKYTDFLKSGVSALEVVIIAVGAGLAVLGIVNLLEGYGNDNPGAKSQGMKQFMAGAGVMLIGALLVPKLSDLIPTSL